MRNSNHVHDRGHAFVHDFNQDHDVEIIGEQVETSDYIEVQHSRKGRKIEARLAALSATPMSADRTATRCFGLPLRRLHSMRMPLLIGCGLWGA